MKKVTNNTSKKAATKKAKKGAEKNSVQAKKAAPEELEKEPEMVKVEIKRVKKAIPKSLFAEDSDYRVVAEYLTMKGDFAGTEEIAAQCYISLERAMHCAYWLAQAKLIAKYKKGPRNYFKAFKRLEKRLAAD